VPCKLRPCGHCVSCAMFLTKGLLDEGEDVQQSLPRNPSGGVLPSGIGHSLSVVGTNGSVACDATMPGPDAVDDAEEVSSPMSPENMRAKMLQQRQMVLAKQRQSPLSARTAVQATAGPCNAQPTIALCINRAFSADDVEQEDEEDERRAVMPEAVDDRTEEERARCRAGLILELNHRGIAQEYDPTRHGRGVAASTWTMKDVLAGGLKAFLQAPVPKEAGMLLCRICRDRTGIHNKLHPKFSMEIDDFSFPLMTAKKQLTNKSANYIVSSLRIPTHSRDEASFVGKLQSDFLGLEWTAYGPGLNPLKADASMLHVVREELLAVQYVASTWGTSTRGPQQMSVVIPRVLPSGDRLICRTLTPQLDGLLALQRSPDDSRFIDRYRNEQPKWCEKRGAFVLNFNSRVTMASVKNFQLVDMDNHELVYLQFGRAGKDTFNLDFQHPLSPFQAFTLCLSCFDYKLGCA